MNNRQLGLFIGKIRTEKGISGEALCEGLCKQSFLSSIEAGEKSTSRLMTDMLLQRLGVPQDGYESYISPKEYKKWEKRCRIIHLVENKEIGEAKKELELYKNDVGDKDKFHLQFILRMESRLIVLEHEDYKSAYKKIRQAVSLTVPRIDEVELADLVLDFNELFLIVECSKLNELAFKDTSSKKTYEKVLEYIEVNKCEELIRAKLYPKTVCLACKYWFLEDDYEKASAYCDKGIKYLQNSGKLYFMPQILENKKIALKLMIDKYNADNNLCDEEKYKCAELKKDYEIVLEWENMIKDLFAQYDVSDEPYEWYPYYTKEIYLIGEVIKKRRIMLNLSQEEFANGICSPVSLSRIENGVTDPYPKIARQLLRKLNLSGEIYSAGIVSDDYEIHKICNKLDRLLVLKKYEEAKILLNELDKKLDKSNPINKQYFMHKQTIIYKNLHIISQEEALKAFKEVLQITIPQNCIFKIPYNYFSKKEIILMNNIAMTFEKLNNTEDALKIYNMLDNYYKNTNSDISNSIITYELVMGSYESLLGNIGMYKKSNEIIEKTIYEALKCRRGMFITGFLYSKAWNMKTSIEEKREMQPSEKDLYIKGIKKSYTMSCIMKDEVLENFIKSKLKCE